jgi:sugar phosphate isomerase/epimerase
MNIGVRCNPLKLKNDFAALTAWLAANDFDSVDLMSPDPELKAVVEEAGLAPGSFDSPHVGTLIVDDREQADSAAAALKDDLNRAADLGLTTLFACFVPVDKTKPKAENFDLWKRVVPDIAAHAERLGVTIAMEPWPGTAPHYATLGTTPEMWRAMFDAAGSPALGLCYDPSHMVRLGVDYVRVLDEFGERIHHVHAKDCAILPDQLYLQGRMPPALGKPQYVCSEGWWRYCIPGDGAVDWHTVTQRLHALGYTGAFSIELEDHFYMADMDANREGLLKARNYLRSLG